MLAAWEDALADPFPATGSGALLLQSPMTSHGYDDDFDIADDGSSWDHYESYAMRRGYPTTCYSHDPTDDREGIPVM